MGRTTRIIPIRTYSLALGWVCSAGTASRASANPPAPASSWNLSRSCIPVSLLLRLGDQVDDREDHDPDDVHEVPVQADHLDRERLVVGEAPGPRRSHEREQ